MALNIDGLENIDVSSIESMTEQQQIEFANTMLKQQTGVDIETGAQILGGVGVILNIISVVFFVAFSVGLYKLSKKFGDKHSWLAFIPLIQFYTLIKTAGFTFWKGFWGVLGRGILAGILSVIVIALMGYAGYMLFQGSSNYGLMFTLGVIGYIGVLFLANYITYFFLFKAMSERAGQDNKTAVLMTLFPFVMLWIVAKRVGDNFVQKKSEKTVNTTGDTVVINPPKDLDMDDE